MQRTAFRDRAEGPGAPAPGPSKVRPSCVGAVIAQRRRRLEVDGETFGGGEAVLPVYRRSDFDALAASGANLVVMSFPELWTVAPPHTRDAAMADILGRQLDDAKAAGLYVVLALRSGPGRSDFIFHRDAQDTWFPAKLIDDTIWTNADRQAAWRDMCVDAAKLVKDRSEVAGLNIMVEPEPNVGGVNRQGQRLGAWEPARLSRAGRRRLRLEAHRRRHRRSRGGAPRRSCRSSISPPAFARTDFLSRHG